VNVSIFALVVLNVAVTISEAANNIRGWFGAIFRNLDSPQFKCLAYFVSLSLDLRFAQVRFAQALRLLRIFRRRKLGVFWP